MNKRSYLTSEVLGGPIGTYSSLIFLNMEKMKTVSVHTKALKTVRVNYSAFF